MKLDALTLTRSELFSTAVRQAVGDRMIDIYGALTKEHSSGSPTGSGGSGNAVLDWVFNTGKKLVGFVLNAITSIGGWALNRLRDWFLTSILTFYTYDWAQTDKALEGQIEQNNLAVIQSIGEFAGTGAVWLGSIAIAGAATFKFPVIAGHVLLKLAEEGGEETRSRIQGVINMAVNKTAENWIIRGFLTARKYRLFGQQPINDQKEPWIIADQIEKKIDSISDAKVKAFMQGFKEGVEDAVIEAIYVVTFGIEEAFKAAKIAQKSVHGKEKLVEILPDERITDETLILRGRAEDLKPIVTNALTTSKLVRNREIGQFVGYPMIDYVKANPHVRKLSITFRSVEKPPFRNPDGTRAKKVCYNIPDVKVGLTWEEIKQFARPFEWGKFRCTANLKNGRQMAVYGASPAEAEQTLRNLIKLTTTEILTLSITEEKDRNIKLKKEGIKVYPAHASLLTRKTELDDPQYVDLEGKGYAEYTQRIELFHDAKPPDLEALK